jgi:hypothetical protein
MDFLLERLFFFTPRTEKHPKTRGGGWDRRKKKRRGGGNAIFCRFLYKVFNAIFVWLWVFYNPGAGGFLLVAQEICTSRTPSRLLLSN